MQHQIIDISDNDRPEPHRWAVFAARKDDEKLHHIGQINKIVALNVPDRYHVALNSPRCNALYISSSGHWAKTLEAAAELLASTEAPEEFIVTGALLGLFPLSEVPEEDLAKPWGEYRIFQDSDGFWSAQELSLAHSAS